MDQSVKLVIGGRDIPLKVSSPEMEQLMRLAAEEINQKLMSFDAAYPDKSLADKLIFVALSETASKIACQRKLTEIKSEAERLKALSDDYLSKI